jgi:hypothetical protein
MCRWRATYCWKDLDKGYNFALDFVLIKGIHIELCAPKVVGVLIVGISKTKWHVGASHVAKHKIYYKGEGGGFPQVQAVVSLVCPCLHVVHLWTKSVPTMH